MDMSQKVKYGKKQHLGHHVFIKLIVEDDFNKLMVTFLWSTFRDMDIETFLDT